jgi:hypothetical protein
VDTDGLESDEELIVEDPETESVAAGAQSSQVARKPRSERCILEKSKLLPLTPNNDWASGFVHYLRIIKTDLSSKSMVGLQKLLAFAFSVEGARSLAVSAQFARSSAGIITLYKDIVATSDAREEFHYSSLAESLAHLARQKFNNVLAEVSLLVEYVNVACVFTVCSGL